MSLVFLKIKQWWVFPFGNWQIILVFSLLALVWAEVHLLILFSRVNLIVFSLFSRTWAFPLVSSRRLVGPIAKFLVSHWGDIVSSGIGLSHWPDKLHHGGYKEMSSVLVGQ